MQLVASAAEKPIVDYTNNRNYTRFLLIVLIFVALFQKWATLGPVDTTKNQAGG
jgi:hypothetical protein